MAALQAGTTAVISVAAMASATAGAGERWRSWAAGESGPTEGRGQMTLVGRKVGAGWELPAAAAHSGS